MKSNEKTIGERMKTLREHYKDVGLTAKNLCNYLKCSTMYLNNWDNDKAKFSADFVTKYAQALGSTYEWLTDGKGTMLPTGKVDISQISRPVHSNVDVPWRDEAFGILKAENEKLWSMINAFMSGKGFLYPLNQAG